MNTSRLNKIACFYMLLYAITYYGEMSMKFKFTFYPAQQWYVLCALIVMFTGVFSLFSHFPLLVNIFETDKCNIASTFNNFRKFNNKLISPVWHIILFAASAGLFQVGSYGMLFSTLTTASALYLFRHLHKKMIDIAIVQELK